ncbi:hypothetical protein E2C01_002161 [Portunus trituberculatus]|uniref:Uncharacterized protein n=1 Tax=Portunus trituberculatus TaxID=210409 RepID=A0A5B7CK94_PORTR|nr:hypothetical protein [Portunus trituberculatus]
MVILVMLPVRVRRSTLAGNEGQVSLTIAHLLILSVPGSLAQILASHDEETPTRGLLSFLAVRAMPLSAHLLSAHL